MYSLSSWLKHVFVYEGLHITIWYSLSSWIDHGTKPLRHWEKKNGIRELTYLCPYTMVTSLDLSPLNKTDRRTSSNQIHEFKSIISKKHTVNIRRVIILFGRQWRPWQDYPDDGPTLNAGLVTLWFFGGSGPVLLGNHIILWFFRGGPDPLPPSRSAHAYRQSRQSIYCLFTQSSGYTIYTFSEDVDCILALCTISQFTMKTQTSLYICAVSPEPLQYSLLSIPRISRDWAKYVELSVGRGNQIMTYSHHFGAK